MILLFYYGMLSLCLTMMMPLFPINDIVPPGFSYFPDFVSKEEEAVLCDLIAGMHLQNMLFKGFEAKRKVASFGYDWSFENRTLSKGKDIPQGLMFIIARVAKQLALCQDNFAEVLLTEYPLHSVINWHRDAPPFDLIAGVSLLSRCVFRFRPHDKAKQNRKALISFPLQRRSLYTIQGPARWEWEHSILPVKQVRYSITLRTLKKETV